MPEITRDLIRKRSEHNEGMITTLEEISLHQEEIESLNEVLGATCRKLKILYLQNNIIPKMENLTHLKELEYLNLALNNITKIEGLQNCEFLKKLDLTVNFVDVDELESSIDHLVSRDRFREFYMMGNPCQVDWPGFESYVIAKLPQIDTLDGKEITRSMRIIATQKLPHLESELRQLAVIKRREKAYKLAEKEKIAAAKIKRDAEIEANNNGQAVEVTDGSDDDEGVLRNEKGQEMTENTPEARIEIYAELAKQKKEKEDRENLNKPKKRDYEKEHQDTLNDIRKKEESIPEDEIKQKNEAGLTFTWDEETKKGAVILEVYVQRYLDSSLIDVDIHPNYISIIIKSKLLRLRLPCEVQVMPTDFLDAPSMHQIVHFYYPYSIFLSLFFIYLFIY
jgi:protein TilB